MATSGNLDDLYVAGNLIGWRQTEKGQLPAEHAFLLSHDDRFLIQNATLFAASQVQRSLNVTFRPQTEEVVKFYVYVGKEPITPEVMARLSAVACWLFYDKNYHSDPNPRYQKLLGGLLTILCTYVSLEDIKTSDLIPSLKECHVKVEPIELLTFEEVDRVTKEKRDEVTIDVGLEDFDTSPQVFNVIAISLLILIGKNVVENNRTSWFRNRWRALAGVAGVFVPADQLNPPEIAPCQGLYLICSAYQRVRSSIFKIMRFLAGIVTDQNHVIFDRIVKLLQWTEMSHIWMIMEYLFGKNPEILSFPELRGAEMNSMLFAIQFLKKYPKEDRPYLKLIEDHNKLLPLQSHNFIFFTAAAQAIAALIQPSMRNMNSRYTEAVKAFQQRVIFYMEKKMSLGPAPTPVKNLLIQAVETQDLAKGVPSFLNTPPDQRE